MLACFGDYVWLDSLVGCFVRPFYCWLGFAIDGGFPS
jgi:hypothetical protein